MSSLPYKGNMPSFGECPSRGKTQTRSFSFEKQGRQIEESRRLRTHTEEYSSKETSQPHSVSQLNRMNE